MSKRRIGSLFTTVLFLVAIVAAALNAQLIRDYAQYYRYTPSETVASFVDATGMNDHGKFLFYASQPSLESAETFNRQCEAREQNSAILGCYDGQKIYIYDIADPRLAGIRPTTAAHEMLHAAYNRLSETDRQSVDALLEAEYLKLKDDVELSDRMAFYARTQPGEHHNELHSIIGTEVSVVSPELETHYLRYFSDRSKVIAQHMQYYSLFEELRTRADTLNNQINLLSEDIQSKRDVYATQSAALQRDIAVFNTRADEGDFSSQAAFATERQALIVRSASLDNLRVEINNSISSYNALVAELNTIAVETNTLHQSMDSNVEPAPSL